MADAFLYFWVGVWIIAQNLHIRFGQNYFPRSYGLRRVCSFVSELPKKDANVRKELYQQNKMEAKRYYEKNKESILRNLALKNMDFTVRPWPEKYRV